MRLKYLVLVASVVAAVPARADLDRLVDFLPESAQISVGLMIEPVDVLDAMAALNLSSPAFHRVIVEQLQGFANESGMRLDKTVDLLVAGTMADPMASAILAHVSVDLDKLEKFLQPYKGEAKVSRVDGNLVADLGENAPRAIFRPDGVIVVAMNPGAEALLKPRATPSPLQKEMKGRGVGGAWVLIDAQFPDGLPQSTPPAEGKSEADPFVELSKSFRGLFLSLSPALTRLVVTFDKDKPASDGKQMLDELVKAAKQNADEQAEKELARVKDLGPFRFFDPEWTAARVAQESAKDVFQELKIEAKGVELEVSLAAKGGETAGGTLVRSTLGGALAAILVPSIKQARLAAQFRACFANQALVTTASEMLAANGEKVPGEVPELLKALKEKGLISEIPADPGQAESTPSTYKLTDGKISCAVHGNADQSIKGSETYPGDVLAATLQKLPIGGGGDGAALPDPDQMAPPPADPEAPLTVEPATPPEGEESPEGDGEADGEGEGEDSEEAEEESEEEAEEEAEEEEEEEQPKKKGSKGLGDKD